MDNSKELKDRERIAKQIAKTSDSIHKKYHALKTDKRPIEEDIALKKHFKPIIESLKQIVENTTDEESQSIKKEANVAKDRNPKKRKPEENQKDDEHDNNDDGNDDGGNFWINNSWLQLTSSKTKQCIQELNVTSDSNYASPESHKLSYEHSHVPSIEDVYETPNEPLEMLNDHCKRDKFMKSCINNWDHLDKNT